MISRKILTFVVFFPAFASSQHCGLDIPLLDDFDYEAWSGLYRYTLYQGTYPDAGAADCQLKYWESNSATGYAMNKTYRYFDGEGDVTDSFDGVAMLEEDEGAAHWLLTLDQGDVYHIMMVETDYSNYAAYVECDETKNNFPVVSSTTLDIDPELLARLVETFEELGANMDGFVQVRHDENCQ